MAKTPTPNPDAAEKSDSKQGNDKALSDATTANAEARADAPQAETGGEAEPPSADVGDIKVAAQPTRLRQQEHVSITWSHVAKKGETIEQMTHPQTFAHCHQQLQVGHEIKVHAADGSWFGELYVRAVGRNEVITAITRHVQFSGGYELTQADNPYRTEFMGPHQKWCVVWKDGGEVVSSGHQTEQAARQWIANRLKALAA